MINHRFFWTWDHSANWTLNVPGGQDCGANTPYTKGPEDFLSDYQKMIDWAALHHVDGIVIWGFLRDNHGGMECAKKLCDYANKKGVKILPGVGLNAYGGVYYHVDAAYNPNLTGAEYNLKTWLERNPELRAVNRKGEPYENPFELTVACPSRPENQQYLVDSLTWLFRNFDLSGVQIETGDTHVCECPLCRKRRKYPHSTFSLEDMALLYPLAVKAIRKIKKDALIICETYSHPQPYRQAPPAFGQGWPEWGNECLARFPEGVFVQWVADNFIGPSQKRDWTDAGKTPNGKFHHIMRSHFGTFWNGYRHQPSTSWLAEMAQKSLASGFDSISIFGESSPFHAGDELNYLALENFGSPENPEASLDVFIQNVAGPILGGEEKARAYLQFAQYSYHPDKIPGVLPKITAALQGLNGEAGRRWMWLYNYLCSFIY